LRDGQDTRCRRPPSPSAQVSSVRPIDYRKPGGPPGERTADNGPEFASTEMAPWTYETGVRLDFSRPGNPVESACIGNFNGRLRDECLNCEFFCSLDDARQKFQLWKLDNHDHRPHGSSGHLTPT
jgi:putative transposase